MKKVYGLCTIGSYKNVSGQGKIISKSLFLTKEEALNHIKDFEAKCCNSDPLAISSLSDLDPSKQISTNIIEFELME